MMFLVGICVALLAVALWLRGTGFARKSASEMEVGEPAIDIRTHLSGPIISEGVIYGPTGKVAGRFVADMLGTFDGRAGTLDEEFSFASGAKQRRKWNLTFNNDGTFTATADDIIVGLGEAGCDTHLSPAQTRRLFAAASEYVGRLPTGQLTPMRFDVALVEQAGQIQIIENALGY